jgi:hypothetical protein
MPDPKDPMQIVREAVVDTVSTQIVETLKGPKPNRVLALVLTWDDEYRADSELRAFIISGPGELHVNSLAVPAARMFASFMAGLNASQAEVTAQDAEGPIVNISGPVH